MTATAAGGLRERAAYGAGDLANGLIFNAATIYLMLFYTEYLGLGAAQASMLLLVARLWNAAVDPVMGIVADRTNSRFGRFRPWLLFVPVPLAVACVAAYAVPSLGADGRLVWAYASQLALMTCYSAINIPYGALPAVMSVDTIERAKLTSWRMVGSCFGGILVSLLFLPVAKLGAAAGVAGGGYALAIGVLALVATALYWTCFAGTRERHAPPLRGADLRGDLAPVTSSRAWWWLLAMGLTMFSLGIFPLYAGLYYLKYAAGQEAWAPVYLGSATAGMLVGAVGNLFLAGRVTRSGLAGVVALAHAWP